MLLQGDPNGELPDILIVVPVHVSGSSDIDPRNFRMPRLHVVGKSPRRFGDNLKRARHCVEDKLIVSELLVIEAAYKASGENSVVTNVKKIRPRDLPI